MTDTKLKEHITSKHFGIPADLADLAENYAQWRVQALSEQLAEAQALIEASRNQEAVLYQRRMKPDYGPHWTTWDDCSRATFKHYLTVPKLRGWTNEARALFAAPVVALDVLKAAERYRWLRSKTLLKAMPLVRVQIMDQGTYALQHGAELDSAIDKAIGGAA